MCEQLTETTTAIDAKGKIDSFFNTNKLSWRLVGSLCTDGAPAMLGKTQGFTAFVKREAPHVISSHFTSHRLALAVKTFPLLIKAVLDIIIRCVNFIRSRSLIHRVFKVLAEDMGTEYAVLLLHTQVRQLSRGLVLSRVFELRTEMETFLRKMESVEWRLHEHFMDRCFIFTLTHLAVLRRLNISLQ